MKLDELRTKVTELRDEITALSDKDTLDEAEEVRFEAALAEYEPLKVEYASAEARAKKVAEIRGADFTAGHDDFTFQRKVDPSSIDPRTASRKELRDAALKVTESEGGHLNSAQREHFERQLRSHSADFEGSIVAKRLLVTENDDYRSGFMKAVTQDKPAFTPEEARAINAFQEFRVASEGTGSAGGFGIPVLIDPSIILTSAAADAPILQISRMVTITTDAWKGVASSGVSWAFQAESAVVADDTPTLVQPSIPVYAARGFIPYSIEVGQDYPGFADEMSTLLNQGYVDLLAKKTCVGSGSGEPTGIFTTLANQTVSPAHITVTTVGTLGAVDVRKAWMTLPERYRPRATWVYSPSVDGTIRAFANAASGLALADFTVDLTKNGVDVLMGRPVVVTDYAPQFTGTTGAANIAVIGDFSNFLVVQRAGMTVELVNHLFDTTTGRPVGQRGWFAFARIGFDAVNPNGFRLISNS
jgi:HK97 family phage major capsid protein